jgi:hypothetical protein
MEELTKLPNLAKAVIAVMKEVKGIDKTLNVGTGQSSYKGVADKDVKQIVGTAMENNGLCILPIDVNASTKIDRWEEVDQYSKSEPKDKKSKQQVFVEVTTKYLLLHESGESIVLAGYGHGVDSQDKSAGKATTYALKYALLYTFMIPTGKIDDADKTQPKKDASSELLLKEITDLYTEKESFIPADKVTGIARIINEKDEKHYKTVKSFLSSLIKPK